MDDAPQLDLDLGIDSRDPLSMRMAATPHDVGWSTLIATMYSAMELIQETCAIMALPRLARVGRAALGVLERLDAGEISATPQMLADVLSAVDAIDGRLSLHGDLAVDSASADDELITRLARWRGPHAMAAAESAAPDRATSAMTAMLLDEIRERLCDLALVAHYLALFPWRGDHRAAARVGRHAGSDN